MNVIEAKHLLAKMLEAYREKPYPELTAMIDVEPDTFEVTGKSGKKYQVEVLAFWDDKPFKNVRVVGSIDDGGVRALSPISEDFIKGPSGEFVGE